MLKFLAGLLASISSLFVPDANRQNIAPPLNTAIVAFQETYYAPAVADPANFPWAKKISSEAQTSVQTSIAKPTLPLPIPLPAIPPPPQDPYLAIPEPITSWLSMNLTLKGTSFEDDRTLPELTFDREYWRIEVFAYWASDIIPPKPLVENDYFKLEIYEKGTDKLIFTMASGIEETMHKFQVFRKPGTYYFKVYSKDPSKWEISFVVSPKIAQ